MPRAAKPDAARLVEALEARGGRGLVGEVRRQLGWTAERMTLAQAEAGIAQEVVTGRGGAKTVLVLPTAVERVTPEAPLVVAEVLPAKPAPRPAPAFVPARAMDDRPRCPDHGTLLSVIRKGQLWCATCKKTFPIGAGGQPARATVREAGAEDE